VLSRGRANHPLRYWLTLIDFIVRNVFFFTMAFAFFPWFDVRDCLVDVYLRSQPNACACGFSGTPA